MPNIPSAIGDAKMNPRVKIDDQVTVGAQPTEGQIQRLVEEGFRSVVNFRTEGEEEQPISPSAEGQKVKSVGMTYLHIPVSTKTIAPELVNHLRKRFADLPKPVFAHCKSGKRAGAMMMMHLAVEQGMTGDQILRQAKEMGLECDEPELERFVREYVDSHASSQRTS
jgi:uncharacterized protein (TIGR01244 family)